MTTEKAALLKLFEAYQELKRLGWNDVMYCPKDGTWFDAIEVGSTGIHDCHYEGTWPNGHWWVADAHDLRPSRPALFRERKKRSESATATNAVDPSAQLRESQARAQPDPKSSIAASLREPPPLEAAAREFLAAVERTDDHTQWFDAIARLHRALPNALREPPQARWQPIETAPTMQRILVGGGGCNVCEVMFGRHGEWTKFRKPPTHWLPLPSPPAPQDSVAGLQEGTIPPVSRVEPTTLASNGGCASAREASQGAESATDRSALGEPPQAPQVGIPLVEQVYGLIRPAWQPIETASKDGAVLLFDGFDVSVGRYTELGATEAGESFSEWIVEAACFEVPTHWMPLPSPPPEARAPHEPEA